MWPCGNVRAVQSPVVSALGDGLPGSGAQRCPSSLLPKSHHRALSSALLSSPAGLVLGAPRIGPAATGRANPSSGLALCLTSLWQGLATGFLQADEGLCPVLAGSPRAEMPWVQAHTY